MLKASTEAAVVLLLLTISCSAISSAGALRAIASVPLNILSDFPSALAAESQTPASSKSWQNARLVRTLPIEGSFLVLSPDSQTLATYRRGEQTRTEGNQKIISQTNENIITLTNINTGEEIHRFTYESPSELKSLVFSPDGRLLASHSYNPFRETLTIRLWDVSAGKELQALRRIVKPKIIEGTGINYPDISGIAFSPDGQSIISTSGQDSTILVWDLADKKISKTKEFDGKTIAFSDPENKQSSPSSHNKIEESVQQDRRQFANYEVSDYRIVNDALDAGKNFEAVKELLRQQSQMVQYWRNNEPKAVYQAKTDFYVDSITRITSQNYVFKKAIAVLEEFGTDTSEEGRKFTGEGFVIEKQKENFVIADNNGQRVILQMKNGNYESAPSFQDVSQVRALVTKLLNSGNLKFTLTGHSDEITTFSVSPDGQFLASNSIDKTMKVWNLKTGKLIHTLKGNSARDSKLVISPDSRLLASVGTEYEQLENNSIKLWDLKTGKLVRSIPIKGIVTFIRFSSDGRKIINTANSPFIDTQIQIWDTLTGQLIHRSPGIGDLKNSTTSIAISPDEKTYAIAGDEYQFQVRNLMTGEMLKNFGTQEFWVDYTADGKSLVTSGREGMKVWQ